MVRTRKFVYSNKFAGFPKERNFTILEEDLPSIKDGEFLLEAKYISVDVVIRYLPITDLNIGDTIWTLQVAKICESKNPRCPVGKHVVGYFPCATYSISDGVSANKFNLPTYIVDDKRSLPKYLAIFGSSMVTAYYAINDVCKPQPGGTVVVTSAAGAVGHLAGQIAKILGCKVIGLSSKSEKCLWLKGLGFDHVINYVTDDVSKQLTKLAPGGIDCFFDNVGGELSFKIMERMNTYGRIDVCGSISSYRSDFTPNLPSMHPIILAKQLVVIGFTAPIFKDKWLSSINTAIKWFEGGKLKTRETIIEGFENYPNALERTYNGENLGKTISKI